MYVPAQIIEAERLKESYEIVIIIDLICLSAIFLRVPTCIAASARCAVGSAPSVPAGSI